MKRSKIKIYCIVISLILTIVIQICASQFIYYEWELLFITSMVYFAICFVITESIVDIVKQNRKKAIWELIAGINVFVIFFTFMLGLFGDIQNKFGLLIVLIAGTMSLFVFLLIYNPKE